MGRVPGTVAGSIATPINWKPLINPFLNNWKPLVGDAGANNPDANTRDAGANNPGGICVCVPGELRLRPFLLWKRRPVEVFAMAGSI